MITLLKNGHVHAPEDLGIKDILIGGRSILAIADHLPDTFPDACVLDCSGMTLIPGLIDSHVHIAGAGGEGGPTTRTPELMLDSFVEAGVTTVIGMLGTDGITRSVESVLQKARALCEEGMSAYILTGAYQVPPPTLTGDIMKDILLVPEVLGVGEIAISDHRSSAPTVQEISRLAKQVRVAGMLAGKPGILCLHLGDNPETFNPINEVMAVDPIPSKHFLPTHCNRSREVFNRAIQYARNGGYVDFTTSAYPFYPDEEVKPSSAIVEMLREGIPLSHMTFSSDAGGSLPDFDSEGRLRGLQVGRLTSLFSEFRDLVLIESMTISDALLPVSQTPAIRFGLIHKGHISIGADADILALDASMQIIHMFANGNQMVRSNQREVFGRFERRSNCGS